MDGPAYARHVARHLEQHGCIAVSLEYEVPKALWRVAGRPFIPFDVSFLSARPLPHREYVECKYHARHLVPEDEVAKFLADLQTCAIPAKHGMIATNTGYAPLARDYARAAGIRLYTLSIQERASGSIFHCLVGALSPRKLPRAFVKITEGKPWHSRKR